MTTPRRFKVNQDNARASTGPRTKAGKARAARNARRHGLSIAIACEPILAAEAEALARHIVGDGAGRAAIAMARAFAEAQVDLDRIRKVRRDVLARLVADPGDDVPGDDAIDKVDQSGLMRQLWRLERYERRALARRKRATGAFDQSFIEAVRRRA
jgi:hypothetical protein